MIIKYFHYEREFLRCNVTKFPENWIGIQQVKILMCMCLCLLGLTDASITEHHRFSLQMLMHKAIKRLYCTRPSTDAITQGCQSVS